MRQMCGRNKLKDKNIFYQNLNLNVLKKKRSFFCDINIERR